MVKSGFASTDAQEAPAAVSSDDRLAELDLISTPIEDLKYETYKIEDYGVGELPSLAWGVYTPGTGGYEEERLTNYSVNPEVNGGKYDLFLAALDPQNGQNMSKTVPTLTSFLAGGNFQGKGYTGAIATLGDMETKEVGARFQETDRAKMFSNFFMADIATMMVGVRMSLNNGRAVAVDQECPRGMQCFMGGKTQCRSMTSLDNVEIKYPKFEGKPLFKVTLNDGFSDGASSIKHLYITPLKLKQLNLFFGGQKIADLEMMKAVIAHIPESEIYGRKKTMPFCQELYEAMTNDDIDLVREAIEYIEAGPRLTIDVDCACGQTSFPYQLPLFRNPRYFLYNSKKLGKEQ